MELLKNAQVKELFAQEAILIGYSDGVPAQRVVELFGEAAAAFASRLPGDGYNVFGTGDYQLGYLTLRGFQLAVTYHNVETIKKAVERND